jgi:hypothetical protein
MIRSLLIAACMLACATPALAAAKKKPAPAKPAAAKPADKVPEKGPLKPLEAPPQEEAAPEEPTPAPAGKKSDAAPAQMKDDLDFDLLGESKAPGLSAEDKAKQEAIEKAGKTRRAVLQAHTAIGFVLLGAMTINTVLGTLNYYDKFGGGGFTRTYENAHLISALITSGIFVTQGGLALFAPDPYPKPGRWDTARVHRIMELAAAIGMATQIVLGFVSSSRLGNLDQRDLARAHLAIGYITYGFTVGGALAWLF